MTEPLTFPSVTPRLALPLLFAGQAQKEATVNNAHALADILLHPAVEGEVNAPPATPAEGECWLVGETPSEAFAGNAQCLAGFLHGGWIFAEPVHGMRLYDRETGQFLAYSDGWRRVAAPGLPSAGSTVDEQARDTIATLIQALRDAGIFPAG